MEASEEQTPLTLDTPDTISDLFTRDWHDWSDADLDRMIEHLRAQRLALGENQAPKAKPKAKTAAPDLDIKGMSAGDLLASLGLGT